MSNLTSHSDLKQQYAHTLANYFGLPSNQTQAWVKVGEQQIDLQLPFCCQSLHGDLLAECEKSVESKIPLKITTNIVAKHAKVKRLNKVKNIIAVASGKGGVGKSTTSVNLAFALQAEGAKVGILDADVYGPSIPIMLGNPKATPSSKDRRLMDPLECHGVVANSIGYLVPAENATIWRGPMASRALNQLTSETLWPELDYLIVDMPPGTGDIQLTLAQQIPVTAAVIVTTPQDLALADAIKGIAMFEKVEVPVLGIIENMSYYQCSKCGHTDPIFASGGGDKLAQQHKVALLGQLPLDINIRQHADGGTPLIIAQPESHLTKAYKAAAIQLSQTLALNATIQDDDSISIVEKH